MLVELAVTSQSDFLVTSNIKDFRNAELRFDQLNVATPGEFAKIWRSKNVKNEYIDDKSTGRPEE